MQKIKVPVIDSIHVGTGLCKKGARIEQEAPEEHKRPQRSKTWRNTTKTQVVESKQIQTDKITSIMYYIFLIEKTSVMFSTTLGKSCLMPSLVVSLLSKMCT